MSNLCGGQVGFHACAGMSISQNAPPKERDSGACGLGDEPEEGWLVEGVKTEWQ